MPTDCKLAMFIFSLGTPTSAAAASQKLPSLSLQSPIYRIFVITIHTSLRIVRGTWLSGVHAAAEVIIRSLDIARILVPLARYALCFAYVATGCLLGDPASEVLVAVFAHEIAEGGSCIADEIVCVNLEILVVAAGHDFVIASHRVSENLE